MNDLSSVSIPFGHHPLGNMISLSQRFPLQSSNTPCDPVTNNSCDKMDNQYAKRIKLDPHLVLKCNDGTENETMDEIPSRKFGNSDRHVMKTNSLTKNQSSFCGKFASTPVNNSKNSQDFQSTLSSSTHETETTRTNEIVSFDYTKGFPKNYVKGESPIHQPVEDNCVSTPFHQSYSRSYRQCDNSILNNASKSQLSSSSSSFSLSSTSTSTSTPPPLTSANHSIIPIKSETINTQNNTPSEDNINHHFSNPAPSSSSNMNTKIETSAMIPPSFKIDTETPPASPQSTSQSPPLQGDSNHSPLNLSGSCLLSLSVSMETPDKHRQYPPLTQHTNSDNSEEEKECDSYQKDDFIIPKISDNQTESKATRKTNFSIEAILSSNFGVDNDSNTKPNSVDPKNSVGSERSKFSSSHSAFKAVDLSIKSRPNNMTSDPPTTPPSPPLSSPSSTSSSQAPNCRSPEYPNKFFNEDADDVSKFHPGHDENRQPHKPLPPSYNPIDPRQNTDSSFSLPGHQGQFLNPFTVIPGSPLINNPSFLVQRNLPMLYNTYGQIIGKFPMVYGNSVQNLTTNSHPEIPMPNFENSHPQNSIVKPDFRSVHMPHNMIFFHAQGAQILNQKRKPHSIPNAPLPSPHPDALVHPDLHYTDSPRQKIYSKYSMDIKDKLNSILDMTSPPQKDTSLNSTPKSLHSKKESKHTDKHRKHGVDKVEADVIKNSPSEPKKDSSDVTESPKSTKSKKGDSSNEGGGNPLLPAWVFCTRYSDRPSSGPRSRKSRRKPEQEEKRPRTAFTNDQLLKLKREFDDNRYLTETRRQNLANELGLSESQIKIWFQNKRAKIKKSVGTKNPLALQLMKQGLYNHSTVKSGGLEEDLA